MQRPLVTRIQRLSMDDGPGLRDVVFLKGCRLCCPWCHNPEAISAEPSLLYFGNRCIGCGVCVTVCPSGAVTIEDERRRTSTPRCDHCGLCAATCPARAIELVGTAYEPTALVRLLLRDKSYYDNSSGGVTFSGGEPARHIDYLAEVCPLLKTNRIHLTIETAGDFALDAFENHLLPYLDLIYFDIKIIDSDQHLRLTGVNNDALLANFEWLVKHAGIPVIPRTPLIPGVVDTEANLTGIETYLRSLNVDHWEKLPFNPAHVVKRARLTHSPAGRSTAPNDKKQMKQIRAQKKPR